MANNDGVSLDLRLNQVREEILTVTKALKESKLTRSCLIALITHRNKKISQTQANLVLDELERLEQYYIKKG